MEHQPDTMQERTRQNSISVQLCGLVCYYLQPELKDAIWSVLARLAHDGIANFNQNIEVFINTIVRLAMRDPENNTHWKFPYSRHRTWHFPFMISSCEQYPNDCWTRFWLRGSPVKQWQYLVGKMEGALRSMVWLDYCGRYGAPSFVNQVKGFVGSYSFFVLRRGDIQNFPDTDSQKAIDFRGRFLQGVVPLLLNHGVQLDRRPDAVEVRVSVHAFPIEVVDLIYSYRPCPPEGANNDWSPAEVTYTTRTIGGDATTVAAVSSITEE